MMMMMMKIPVFMSQVQPDKKCTVSQTLEFSQLDTIQIKKGLAHCNVHNKNNHSFICWKWKLQNYISILQLYSYPILFLIMINNLSISDPESSIWKYVDDVLLSEGLVRNSNSVTVTVIFLLELQ